MRYVVLISLLTAGLCSTAFAHDTLAVGKILQKKVELNCRLDVFTPMLYEGLTSDVGGKTSFTFNKNCAELQGREVPWSLERTAIHPKTVLSWNKSLGNVSLSANGNQLDIGRQLKSSFTIVSLGRMSLLVFDTKGWLYDNTEQHWCPFPMTFPHSKGSDAPLFWYDKASSNVVRLYQEEWNAPLQKTQHFLPAACSNSSSAPPPPKPVRYRFKDLPVRVWEGPVVLTR